MLRAAIRTRVSAGTSCSMRRQAGRPKVNLDSSQVVMLREEAGLSWRALAKQLRAGATTVRRAYQNAKRLSDSVESNPEGSSGPRKGSIEQESA